MIRLPYLFASFFFNDTATTEIYTLSLHDALPIYLGLLPEHFFPKEGGRDYALSPYLEGLKEHRGDFTVFSGVSHPDVDGGHPADNCFLTAAPHPGSAGFRNTISLDQYISERLGHLTR